MGTKKRPAKQPSTKRLESIGPVLRTREQIKRDLLDNLSKILGCGVTPKALAKPSEMTFDDIHSNIHLYERLGVAFEALGALNGYTHKPRGYTLVPENSTQQQFRADRFSAIPNGTPFRSSKPTESDSLILVRKIKPTQGPGGIMCNTEGFGDTLSFTEPETVVWFCPMTK